MPKSAKQLDTEIAHALSKVGEAPAATSEFYYAVYPDDEHLKLYGPYETWKDAVFAGYFHKSADERTRVMRTRNGTVNFLANGVEQHSADAVKTLTSYPREHGYKSVKVMRRAPPMHASWKDPRALGAPPDYAPHLLDDLRQRMRESDWNRAEEDRRRL